MGRTTVKPETIEEGLRLCVGGKEIEVFYTIFNCSTVNEY